MRRPPEMKPETSIKSSKLYPSESIRIGGMRIGERMVWCFLVGVIFGEFLVYLVLR